MTPESTAFFAQAHLMIARAERMLTVSLNEDAARAAYLACFHTAQAYIFERTGKTSKSHHGVQTEFFRLSRDDMRTDLELRLRIQVRGRLRNRSGCRDIRRRGRHRHSDSQKICRGIWPPDRCSRS